MYWYISVGIEKEQLQRRASRKYLKNNEGSKFVKTSNAIKIEKQIKLLHRKLANIRSNHSRKATNMIVETKPSRVVMETLNIKDMMKNFHLAKAIANNISAEEALVKFMTAHTYDLFRMDSSKLWSESQEYVLDMLSNEFNNDLTNWLKI